MRRGLILAAVAVAVAPGVAAADDAATDAATEAPAVADRELGATVGAAIGGDVTPGGLRVAVSYLHQLSDDDWFDGGLAFTFGSGTPACFRDRADELVCDHGAASGVATDVVGGVRRVFGGEAGFRPYVRAQVAARIVRFGEDRLTGLGVVAIAGAGVRARVTETIAVGGAAQLELGAGWFGRGLGPSPQLGLAIGATVEFALP